MAGFLSKFFGRTVSEAAGFGIGGALTRPLEPLLQELTNETWVIGTEQGVSKPVDPAMAAEVVAEDVEAKPWGELQAKESGYTPSNFDAILGATLNAPGIGMLFELWRRDLIADGDFTHGLRKARLELRWDGSLEGLKQVLLSPEDLAMMRQQGFIDQTRQYDESAKSGVDNERAELLFDIAGLPPGIETGLTLWRRGLIDEARFAQIVREGHTKIKYTADLEKLFHDVLSPATATQLRLRGWITQDEQHRLGGLSGFTGEQMDRMYEASGRPMAPVQAFTAFFRGAPGPDGGTFGKDDFLRAIRQSDIRPEYGEPLWGIRFAYPSLFQLRRAVQDGSISPARALTILHYERYEEQDATALVQSWSQGGAAAAKGETVAQLRAEYEGLFISETELRTALAPIYTDPATIDHIVHLGDAARVKTYRDAAVRLVATSYVKHDTDEATARGELGALNISAEATDHLVAVWNIERQITRKELTDAKVRAAFRKLLLSRAEALDELEGRGYTVADANTYLDA